MSQANVTAFLILLLLVLVGLVFTLRPDSPTSDSPASGASAEEPQEETFDLAIQEGTLVPGEISVEEGERVDFV